MQHLLIYTDNRSARLDYIFNFILSDILGVLFSITNDKDSFLAYNGPKFSYTSAPLADELFLSAHPFLFEQTIKPQPIDFVEYNNIKGFFPVFNNYSAIPFDIFASAFFMVVRYEEYLPGKKDKYDRYRGSQSMNHKAGFLEKPMIDLYALELKKSLLQRFPEMEFGARKFTYKATFDIDMAYSYKHKGFKRNFGGFLRGFIMSDYKELRERFAVLTRGVKDPFDTYDYIFEVCNSHNIPTCFFFLLGDESRFDKNIEFDNEAYRQLIKDINDKAETGIHLSFKSHISNRQTDMEIKRLADITGQKVERNRYHYLRFQIPSSYTRLVQAGITKDYSMGYAGRVGFRAGTCTPHQFFNLKTNMVTDLQIIPFAFMDTTFTHYYRTENSKSLEKIRELMKSVKEVEGPLVALWHNSSFTEQQQWRGWREIFETVARESTHLT